MLDILQGMIVAFAMYSKIPMPGINWTKNNMKYAICFFPMIGAVIGLVMLGWFYLAEQIGMGQIFRTSVAVLIPVMITGGIHLDGLLDTADALSSYKSREERLEILKDSHAGAFAIIVGISYFVLQFGVYSELTFEKMKVLALGFVVSRSLSGLALVSFRKAKNTGLLRTFSDASANRRVAVVLTGYLLVIAAGLLMIQWKRALVMLAAALLTFVWYRSMSYRIFGGITGDLAGFFLQIAELAMALGVALMC